MGEGRGAECPGVQGRDQRWEAETSLSGSVGLHRSRGKSSLLPQREKMPQDTPGLMAKPSRRAGRKGGQEGAGGKRDEQREPERLKRPEEGRETPSLETNFFFRADRTS